MTGGWMSLRKREKRRKREAIIEIRRVKRHR